MEKGYFTPKIDPEKKPFIIIMPPPNVTGELHLGHALYRHPRRHHDPLAPHEGRADALAAGQSTTPASPPRWWWRASWPTKGSPATSWAGRSSWSGCGSGPTSAAAASPDQHKRLGVSCDWTRERFTLDEGPARAVRTAFVRLYDKGLIYRGERIINWCPRCATALSDLEVEHEDVAGPSLVRPLPPRSTSGQRRRVHHRRHHPPGDHPGRYGRGRQPGG